VRRLTARERRAFGADGGGSLLDAGKAERAGAGEATVALSNERS
jgi:hypothetical protein